MFVTYTLKRRIEKQVQMIFIDILPMQRIVVLFFMYFYKKTASVA